MGVSVCVWVGGGGWVGVMGWLGVCGVFGGKTHSRQAEMRNLAQ